MSDGSYTYTTISAHPGEPTRIGVFFYLDEHARISAYTEAERPFLSVSHGDVSVSISPRAAGLTARDAEIARQFADQAAKYAAEVERRLAVQASGPAAA
jgi:hypothetical protein